MHNRTSSISWLAWIALAAVWLGTIQVRPLLDPDEGRYAEIPREMAASGDWVTPRLNDLKYFEKPPLQYWMTAAVYSAVGVSPWSSRLWSFALAFGCLPMVFAWTRRLYGEQSARAALLALAVSPYFGIIGHLNLLDAGFTFWLTGTVFAFLLAQNEAPGSKSERRWMLAAWAGAALAVLSKGIVVGVLAGASLIAYSVLERDGRPWKRLHAAVGIPVFLCIAAPWFILVSRRNPDFLQFFFIHEHFARYLTTVHQRVEPWWYFIPIVLIGALPWLGDFVRICRAAWNRPHEGKSVRPLRFLLIYAGITFVFFSTSGSKLSPYVLPVMPALATVLGAQISSVQGWLARAAWIGGGLLLIVAAGLQFYGHHRNGFLPVEVVAWSAVAVAAAAIGALAARGSEDTPARVLTVAAAGIVGWQSLVTAFAGTQPALSSRDLVVAVRSYIHPDTALYSVGQFRETIPPYLQRTLRIVDYTGELEFGLHAEPGRNEATVERFIQQWTSSPDALAFIAASQWPRYQQRSLPGRVIAADGDSVVVSRH